MYILSIETTGKYGSAALIDGDGRISSKSSHEEMNHLDKIDSEEKQIIFVGDGIDAYEDKIREAGLYRLADEEWRYQDASSVAELALQKYNSNNTITYDYLLPNYMRKSEAEMRLESGTLSSKIGKLR